MWRVGGNLNILLKISKVSETYNFCGIVLRVSANKNQPPYPPWVGVTPKLPNDKCIKAAKYDEYARNDSSISYSIYIYKYIVIL